MKNLSRGTLALVLACGSLWADDLTRHRVVGAGMHNPVAAGSPRPLAKEEQQALPSAERPSYSPTAIVGVVEMLQGPARKVRPTGEVYSGESNGSPESFPSLYRP